MKKFKFVILGAGPAGLTAANLLLDRGISDFVVLEKESVAGGLCRTVYIDGNPVDIGGGHVLDAKNEKVDNFFFRFLEKKDWNVFNRDSQIMFNGQLIGSPFESHIWQLPVELQVEYLKSIAVAGCNLGQPMPQKFCEWISWKLGNKIAKDYMIPYNKKMFSKNLNLLGTYWLEKLPNVSIEDTLYSCLNRKFYGKQPCHSIFYYPKKEGFGDNFIRMQQRLDDHFVPNYTVDKIDFENRSINNEFSADNIIVTIPWTEFSSISGMPLKYVKKIAELKYSSVQIDYYKESLPYKTSAQWIYYPSDKFSFHRIMALENFSIGSKGYWTETNSERVNLNTKKCDYAYLNKYAYPMNTIGKNEIMQDILTWCRARNVYGVGRWGEWQHYNCDVVMERTMDLIEKLA